MLIVRCCCLILFCLYAVRFFFFFNDTATTEIYTLSLHDALPICTASGPEENTSGWWSTSCTSADRKSTRLNSSHTVISYAVFCLKKKNQRGERELCKHKKNSSNPSRSTIGQT